MQRVIGNPKNGIFDIAPPSVEDYLYSVNHNLLVPLVNANDENDNFGPEPAGNRLYNHFL